jgi:hypothetical protein
MRRLAMPEFWSCLWNGPKTGRAVVQLIVEISVSQRIVENFISVTP